jgi:hypothetical protein
VLKHRLLLVICLTAIVSLSLLSAQRVITDYDRSADFSNLKKWSWVQRDKLTVVNLGIPEDMKLAPDATIDAYIRSHISAQLKKKGFQEVGSKEEADFLVSHIMTTQLAVETQEYDSSPTTTGDVPYGHWRPFYSSSADSMLQRKGTLSIDIVNPEDNKLMWRATAVETLDESKATFKEAQKRIRKSIEKSLKKFPPKK